MNQISTVISIMSLVSLLACNYNIDKAGGLGTDPNVNKQLDPSNKANLNFANILQNALGPNCLGCHSSPRNAAGINLETYENVFTHKAEVMGAVQSGSMPRSRPMPATQKALLLAWIESGAPKDAPAAGSQPQIPKTPQPPQTPQNPNEMDPSKPANLTFPNVLKNVIQTACFSCHATPSNAAGVNLETYENVFANRASIASAIQSGFMPRNRSFSAEQRALILAWLESGAPRGPDVGPTQPNPTPSPTPPCDDH